MTDRPTLEDLDAAPEPARWCCSGNAEDCPLCDTRTLPYPWICPGHPDTETNRQRVQAAHEGPQPAPWSQLEAHAFNAVQPALREAGRWLPMSARRAVARAVLAAVQPHLAGHYQHAVNAAVAAEQRATQAETKLHRYRDWLATQHANAARADQAGGVPDYLKISPHNGLAAGLHTALLGLDHILNPHDAGPTVAEAAAQDRAYWERKDAGEQP